MINEVEDQIRRQKECLDKLTWESGEQAIAAAAYARWQHGEASQPKPYQCRHCAKWHLSS